MRSKTTLFRSNLEVSPRLRDRALLLILSSLGGILEFYDFIIFALFADYISTAFFPASMR